MFINCSQKWTSVIKDHFAKDWSHQDPSICPQGSHLNKGKQVLMYIFYLQK